MLLKRGTETGSASMIKLVAQMGNVGGGYGKIVVILFTCRWIIKSDSLIKLTQSSPYFI